VAEERKGQALGAGLLGAAAGGAVGAGLGYVLGKSQPAKVAPEEPPKETIVVFQLDEATIAAIAQGVTSALEPILEELAMPAKVQKQTVFKQTPDPLQGIIEHQRIPTLKTVRTITIHWPPGCNALVEVAVGYSQDKRLLPEEGYLALDNTTPTWSVNKDTESDTLWVEIRNGDAANAHTISVIVNYEEA
jgi:hypothetical protein